MALNTEYQLKTISTPTSFWSLLTLLNLSPFVLHVQVDVKTEVLIFSDPHNLDVKTEICLGRGIHANLCYTSPRVPK
jgi:hypothetical protein